MSDEKEKLPNTENYAPKRTFGHHNGTGRKKGSITKTTKITEGWKDFKKQGPAVTNKYTH